MAYFDNPENKRSWEAAMVGLREERARRQAGEAPEEVSSIRGRSLHSGSVERVPVTFEQLLEEDRAERMMGKAAPEAEMPSLSREAEPEMGRGI